MTLSSEYPIGIVIPVYNKALLLRETLLSLEAQTYRDFKAVVVDDGSTDEIAVIFQEFEEDKRFLMLKNEKNMGESISVNRGWAFLNTKYIAIVNSDDPQQHNWLKVMSNFAFTNPGYVTYYPNLKIIDDNSNELDVVELPSWRVELVRERLNCVASAGALHDKSLFPEGFVPRDPNVIYPSDLIQYLTFTLYGESIKVPGILGVWRRSRLSLTSRLTGQFKAIEFTTAIRQWYLKNYEIYPAINFRKMDAYMLGQTWKLIRNDEGVFNSVKFILSIFPFSWFGSYKNLIELVKAILERTTRRLKIRNNTQIKWFAN
jgi:glycosyltransferase involved in cell wall biosynthesis